MEKHQKSIMFTLVLGIISIFCLFLTVLALLDINQGKEPDMANEWKMVFTGFTVFFLFSITTIITSIRLLIKKL